jgi:hypothetical protein
MGVFKTTNSGAVIVSGLVVQSGGGGVTDHGALAGLLDDDHTQYVLADGSRDIAPDTDLTFTIGRCTLFSLPSPDWATFAHVDRALGGQYALGQNAAGTVWVNCPTGQGIKFTVNNVHMAGVDANGEFTAKQRYGGIYVTGGSTPQTITTGGTFEKFTGFTTNVSSFGTTPDQANDRIRLGGGNYFVWFQVSFSGTTGATITFAAYMNGSIQNQCRCVRKLNSAGDVGSCSAVGMITSSGSPWDLELWFTTGSNGQQITAVEAQLMCWLVWK